MAKILEQTGSLDGEGRSYRIDFGGGMVLWFDVWRDSDGEITGDWNMYIFNLVSEEDMKIKAFQEANNNEVGAYNYMTALELATEAFEMSEATR